MKKTVTKLVVLAALLAVVVSGCTNPFFKPLYVDSAEAAADTFKTDQSSILEETADTITVGDEAAVDAALAAYELLNAEVKELLTAVKTLLDSLKAKIAELKASAAADTFETTYGDIFEKTVDTITVGDEAAVDAALAAYELLSADAKALLIAEKTLLDSLKTKINDLKGIGAPPPPDTTPPAFSSAAVNGTNLVITLSEAASGTPDAGDFTVTIAVSPTAVNTAVVSGNTVMLTLASAAANGNSVTVAYTQNANAAKQIKDAAGNALATFTVQNVTNNTGASKTVTTVGTQTGTLTYGTAGSATFAVTSGGITGSVPVSLAWFTTSAGTTSTSAPIGVAVTTPVSIGGSPTNITLTTTTAATAGAYYFKVIIDGKTSTGVGTVAVAQKTLTNSGLEVAGSVTAKTYNGTTTASGLTIAIKAASKVGADTVGITGISYAFASANASTSVAIAFSGTPALSGAQRANYTLSGINLSAAPFAGITGTINKAAGAAVSGAPTVSGVPTSSSITVNAVTASSGTQTVEYAISTSSGSTPASGWQDNTTFNSGLAAGTSYYVYARTKANGNYNAGTAQHSAAISTAVDPLDLEDFGAGVVPTVYTVTSVGEFNTAWSSITAGGNYVINVSAPISVSAMQTLSVSAKVSLRGGGTITQTGSDNLFYVSSGVPGGTLILRDITLNGPASGSTSTGVMIRTGSRFIMHDGADIKNFTRSGVRANGGSFTMEGGSIHDNTSYGQYGGGVYADFAGGGVFTMNGGSIYSNTTNNNGGGVYVIGGQFIMNGGYIYGNTANNGDGVYVGNYSPGTFRMYGGLIVGYPAAYGYAANGHSLYKDAAGTAQYGDGTNILASGTSTSATLLGKDSTGTTWTPVPYTP